MRVKINVKKIGKNRGAIEPVFYEYPEGVDTVEKLLRETVRINLEEFTSAGNGRRWKRFCPERI